MSTVNQQIRELAERVAASHGLSVVDLEFAGGGGRHRTLRVFLERDAAGRATLAERLKTLRAGSREETKTETAPEPAPGGSIILDLAEAPDLDGEDADEETAYLRDVPPGVPVEQLSGMTHSDCERFSRDFGVVLDVEDLVPGTEYMLEVSSPGLDRRLSTRGDFERFTGQLCQVQTFTPVGGNRRWQGHLGRVTEDSLALLPTAAKKAKKGKKKVGEAAPEVTEVEIALSNIERAQLAPEF